ncbi:MAG: hypothetical protein OSJ54_13620 [Oscillospiraceae bacterium]|nr:hypothetical protein [Oscillospiraceae bacterium]
MTKTKRVLLTLLIFFALGIGVLLVALPTSSVVYAAAETETVEPTEEVKEEKDWGEWVKQELVPYAVLAISAIGTIIIGVSPILAKVKKASDKFKDATNDVNGTKENGEKSIQKIESLAKDTEAKLQGIADDFSQKVKNFDERLTRIEQASVNAEQISRIGFGNMEELVKNGYAAEIEKVGKNGKDQEATES